MKIINISDIRLQGKDIWQDFNQSIFEVTDKSDGSIFSSKYDLLMMAWNGFSVNDSKNIVLEKAIQGAIDIQREIDRFSSDKQISFDYRLGLCSDFGVIGDIAYKQCNHYQIISDASEKAEILSTLSFLQSKNVYCDESFFTALKNKYKLKEIDTDVFYSGLQGRYYKMIL